MKIKGFSLPVIIIAFVLALGVFMSLNWVYTEMAVKKPLGQEISEVDGVRNYTIEKGTEGLILTVELDMVNNIQTAYSNLNEIGHSHVKDNEGFEIRIVDNPNNELITVWNEIQYYAYQSLAQGDFVTLKDSMQSLVQNDENIDYQVYINDTHLFIQVQSHENYIYRIMQRTNTNL
ncbi:MAG: hypothetical protein APF76_04245 [Desulfitibacter sp. BRH_c19]|nr:MAG: hypothetical protein APF76_04245 [Desulfitibacter sp. BRH_c19]